ncbi:MAG TPA: hypothetical protein QF753_07120 [Victivallales bacterium]|nr:hypothetical protein [Victivallales bacterium]
MGLFFKKKKLTREEKIQLGFQKTWKIVVIFLILGAYFIFYFLSKNELEQVNKKENIINVLPVSIQKKIFIKSEIIETDLKAKCRKEYPNYYSNEDDNKLYRKKYYKLYNISAENLIKKHKITMEQYVEILRKGDDKHWGVEINKDRKPIN